MTLMSELRPLPAARTTEIEEDVMLDIGEDGQPVGYDIQHASTKREFIARLILEQEHYRVIEARERCTGRELWTDREPRTALSVSRSLRVLPAPTSAR